jgi:hypothetical protein
MHAVQDERRAKAAFARRRHVERNLGRGKRLQALSQSPKLGVADPTASAAGVHQSAVWGLVGQQECPEERS